jgi:hypothetical protein
MRWCLVGRGDGAAVALANRHYSRRRAGRTVGPPGAPVVLRTPEGDALWVTSRSVYDRLDGFPTGWSNNYFRSESGHQASELIREAIAATLHVYGPAPADGLVTYVDPAEIRSSNPGWCFLCAGFEHVRWTAGGHGRPPLRLLHLPSDRFPPAAAPLELAPGLAGIAA